MIEKILSDSQALLKGHFILTSGRHSEFYVEKIKIINNPVYVEMLCEKLANLLKDYDCDVVIGPAYGGIVLAFEVARKLNKKFVFSQRKDEKMSIRSGFEIKPGDRAIIIEDIVTTGGSVNEVIALLKSMEVDILAIGCIVDRSGGKANFGCDFVPLLTMNIETFDPQNCPLCDKGLPLIKPGASDKK
jgi:orotate phosphoribosyltransferase